MADDDSGDSTVVSVDGWTDDEKEKLLHELWKPVADRFAYIYGGRLVLIWDRESALEALQGADIDWLCGCCFKIDPREPEWDLRLYDRDKPAYTERGKVIHARILAEIVAKRETK